MTPLIAVAAVISLALAPLILVRPKNIAVNPAAYTFVIFLYAIFAKAVYFTYFYYPSYDPADRIFGFETTTDFLWTGIWIASVAAGAYILGFLAPRQLVPAQFTTTKSPHSNFSMVPLSGAVLAAIGFGVAFLLFVIIGGHDLFGNMSQKRFLSSTTGVSSRFELLDYYFFKIASLALPLTVVANFMWMRTSKQLWAWLFWYLLAFSIYITIFANIRLIFIIMGAQLLLLVWFTGGKRRLWLIPILSLAIVFQMGTATLLRSTEEIVMVSAEKEGETQIEPMGLVEKAAYLIMRGRYYMDLSKISRIGNYFPSNHPFLLGQSILGVPVTVPDDLSDVIPERSDNYPGWNAAWGGESAVVGSTIRMRINQYVATYIFREPGNGVTLFTAQAYLDFGHAGVAVLFLLLGFFHRVLYNTITHANAKWWAVLGGTIIIPTATLFLLNSGVLATVTRLATDLSVIPICLLLGWLWRWPLRSRRITT